MSEERPFPAAKGTAVVKTKRGFNITKQKHQGLAFVNSSSVNEKSQTWSEFSKPLPPKMKFVAQKNVAGHKRRRGGKAPQTDKDSVLDDIVPLVTSRRKAGIRKAPNESTQSTFGGPGSETPELGCEYSRLPRNQHLVVDDTETEESLRDFVESYNLKQFNLSLEPSCADPIEDGGNKMLPNWVANALPNGPSEESKLFMRACMGVCPGLVHRVQTDMDLNLSQADGSRRPITATDISTMDCATALEIFFQQFRMEAWDDDHFSVHYGVVCSLVSQLLNSERQTRATEAAKAHCISRLAVLASFLGRYDDWNIHMRGLKNFVEFSGGQQALPFSMLTAVRKADLTGAFELGIEPTLDFQLFCCPVSSHVPIEESNATRFAVRQALSGCPVSESMIDILGHLATTSRAISIVISGSSQIAMDYQGLLEDYYHLEYRLLSQPGMIRNQGAGSTNARSGLSTYFSDDDDRTYFAAWFLDEMVQVSCDASMEAALCITAFLYLKVLNGPNNDSVFSFIAALNLLTKHLRNILNGFHDEAFDTIREASLIGSLSPSLSPMNFSRAGARPALVWVCLAADTLVRAYNVSRYKGAEVVTDWTAVYRELLIRVVGPSASDVEPLTVADLGLCLLFDFGKVMNQQWDVYSRLRHIY